DGSDVTIHTTKLLNLMKVDPDLPGGDRGRNSARPPWVEFHWGKLHSFRAVIEKLQLRYTYFASDGMPLRAKVDLSLKQWKDEAELPLQNPTSSTPMVHSVHTLLPGETLDRVAAAHYQDPNRWRLFAEDRFRLGTRIEIAFRAEDDLVVVTSGEVTAISVEPGTSGRHELVVTGLDLTHRLARGPKTRTFLRMTESDIASRIAGEYGLDTDIDPVTEVREY